MKIVRIHFEDHGQDFLTWDVDAQTGEVVESKPFQGSIWTKCTVKNIADILEHYPFVEFAHALVAQVEKYKQNSNPVCAKKNCKEAIYDRNLCFRHHCIFEEE